MKVVLKQDLKGTGKKDEICEVSDGYARNYLLPRKLAVIANANAVNEVMIKESAKKHHSDELLTEAKAVAAALEGKTVTIKAKAGSGGRLFGSVTAKDVADALKEQYSIEVDKKKLLLEADIKAFGDYTAVLKLHAGVAANLKVSVNE